MTKDFVRGKHVTSLRKTLRSQRTRWIRYHYSESSLARRNEKSCSSLNCLKYQNLNIRKLGTHFNTPGMHGCMGDKVYVINKSIQILGNVNGNDKRAECE